MESSLTPGTIVRERYQINGILGEGASGTVYSVDDRAIAGARWAMKEIRNDLLPPDERADRLNLFARECSLLAKLNHTGLPKVIDSFSTGDRHYMVMEFIEGESLHTRLRDRGIPFEPHQVIPWVCQVLDILEYLHGQEPPVIFRDLKPSNIVITAGGKAKLIDFGIARLFQPGKPQDTQVMGTPGFSAPEQYGTGQTDARSDVYSLGATMFSLLCSQDPERYHFQFPPPVTINENIPPWLSSIISKALAIRPGIEGGKAPPLAGALPPPPAGKVLRAAITDLAQEPWRAWGYCMVLILCTFIPCVGGLFTIPGYLGLAILAVASLIMSVYYLVKKDIPRAFSSLGVVAASLAVLAIPLLILLPSFSGTGERNRLDTCVANLRTTATAIDLYAADHEKALPPSLSGLTPAYLREIPACPAARSDTYSTSYTPAGTGSHFTIYCSGFFHKGLVSRPDYPRFSSHHGIIVDPGDL